MALDVKDAENGHEHVDALTNELLDALRSKLTELRPRLLAETARVEL